LLPDADKITLGNWINCWLTDYIKPNVRIKSYEKYESCVNGYIRPKLGHISIAKIKAPDVQKTLNDLLVNGGRNGAGISSSTVRTTRRYLSMALRKAVQVGILSKNVVEATIPPRLIKEEIRPFTEEQANKLIAIAKAGEYLYLGVKQRRSPSLDHEYHKAMAYIVVVIALSTGMRLGEVFGLKWCDIDFTANTLCVQRALVSSNTKGMIFEEPKTKGSKRKIPVTVQVMKEVLKYQKEQCEYANFIGDKFVNQYNLLFTNLWGKPVDILKKC